jgi:hypothetical protein
MEEPLVLTRFGDFVAALDGLQQRFKRAHAAALTDDAGRLLDLTAFTGRRHTADYALDWALCFALDNPGVRRLLG